MKLCKDCKHFKDSSIAMGWCTNPKLDNKDLVYGNPAKQLAEIVRKDYNSCGTTGSWWENITPQPQPKNFWQKLTSK